MKCGARVALGVAGGYFLGRTKKMKFAMMLAGMAAGRRAGGPGELLKSGTKLLSSSPELARLSDEVRGRLLEAGKGAAMAVATRQVEALTDRVGKRVESLGDLGTPRRRSEPEPEPEPEEDLEETQADMPAAGEDEYADEPVQASGSDTVQDTEPGAGDEEPAEPQEPARRRPAGTPAAKSPRARSGAAATATVRRTASGATGAAGKAATARKAGRTRRGGSDE